MNDPKIPGIELIEQGIEDLRQGRESIAALLVDIAAPRLRFIGFDVPPTPAREPAAELRLYALLCVSSEVMDPYRRYNDLLRRLDSACRALESQHFARVRGQSGSPSA